MGPPGGAVPRLFPFFYLTKLLVFLFRLISELIFVEAQTLHKNAMQYSRAAQKFLRHLQRLRRFAFFEKANLEAFGPLIENLGIYL